MCAQQISLCGGDVMDNINEEFRERLPRELTFAGDLVVIRRRNFNRCRRSQAIKNWM